MVTSLDYMDDDYKFSHNKRVSSDVDSTVKYTVESESSDFLVSNMILIDEFSVAKYTPPVKFDNLFCETKSHDFNKVWNHAICSVHASHEDIKEYLYNLTSKIKSVDSDALNDVRPYREFVVKTYVAYRRYVASGNENKLNLYSSVSLHSLAQLLRFVPQFLSKNKDSSVYIDSESGCFGLVIQPKRAAKNKMVLNLLMKDNKEVIYSLVKKRAGIIKISGRAYFNENIDDSDEINNILVWVSDDAKLLR